MQEAKFVDLMTPSVFSSKATPSCQPPTVPEDPRPLQDAFGVSEAADRAEVDVPSWLGDEG